MYNSEEIKNALSTKIKLISESPATDYIFRCPYCGDSKNLNHGHLYVDKYIPRFHCFRCGISGHVSNLLRDVGIHDIVVREDKDISVKKRFDSSRDKDLTTINVSEKWFNYIAKRLNVDYQDVYRNKSYLSLLNTMVLDSLQFTNVEEDFEYTYRQKIKSGDYICFVTHLKTMLICRDISAKQKRNRYINIKISNSTVRDMYVIVPFVTKSRNAKVNKVYISEGVFDSLGLYFYFKQKVNLHNTLFVSVLSNSYSRAVSFVDHNFRLPKTGFEFNFFLDNDDNLKNHRKNIYKALDYIEKNFPMSVVKMYINTNGKDYGDGNIKLAEIETIQIS